MPPGAGPVRPRQPERLRRDRRHPGVEVRQHDPGELQAASEFEPVLCLEAPELAEVPRSLRRADGRSVHRRYGGVRYATRAQLGMEERMIARTGGGRAAHDPRGP